MKLDAPGPKSTLIALAIAVIIAVVPPIGYGLVAVNFLDKKTTLLAELNAARVAKYIYAHEKMWQYQRVRIAELIEQDATIVGQNRLKVIDDHGKVVVTVGAVPDSMRLSHSVPLKSGDRVAGSLIVSAPLAGILETTGWIALITAIFGVAAFMARVIPLRAIGRLQDNLRALNSTLKKQNMSLHRRERHLHVQNERFEAATENMTHGLCMYDRNDRLLVANKQFAEMYQLPEGFLIPGTRLADTFVPAFGRGEFADGAVIATEALLASIAPGQRLENGVTLPDGRTIAFSIQRMHNGDWVAVHKDVTEQKRKSRELKQAEATVKLRSLELLEVQRLGKIGDWSYDFGSPNVWWSTQIYDLLGYDPAVFRSTRSAVLGLYLANGAELVMESQTEAVRAGEVRSVDVKVRRANGTIGDFVLTSKAKFDDNGRVVGVFGTIQDITERKFAEEQLEHLAYHDPLTGLANRALFQRKLDTALARFARTGNRSSLLLLDLDRFKDVNDSLGHATGDELLARVSHLIARQLGNAHFVSRLGGDEFAIILDHVDGPEKAEQVAAGLLDAISGTMVLNRSEVNVGTSMGIAHIPQHGSTAPELLRNADLALYRAKDDGRGRYKVFEPGMNDAVQYKIELARDLRRALTEDVGLSVHYQPQISLADDKVSGYEALIRWNHPTRGPIPPSEFIPIAESSHLISDLGNWVLRQAATQAKAWLDAGEPPREIAVNLSVAQIWNTDIIEDVQCILQDVGLPPHLLCLELTESLLADHDEGRVRSVLSTLKKAGVKLALDDFGTGYSSLGYLTQLPFDKLKIDRIFVDGVTNSNHSRELLKGIIALGRGLGMTVVGEGAETQEEVDFLRAFGCDEVQGFIFAHPASARDALAFTHQRDGAPANRGLGVTPLEAKPSRTSGAAA